MAQTVLVVDDDPVVRMLIKECLSVHGYTVETLESGPQCLERLKAKAPDLVFLDLLMPDMTGIEVLTRIRSNPKTAELPVIMLSAHTDTASVMREEKYEPNQYLQKPFNMRQILGAVEGLAKVAAKSS